MASSNTESDQQADWETNVLKRFTGMVSEVVDLNAEPETLANAVDQKHAPVLASFLEQERSRQHIIFLANCFTGGIWSWMERPLDRKVAALTKEIGAKILEEFGQFDKSVRALREGPHGAVLCSHKEQFQKFFEEYSRHNDGNNQVVTTPGIQPQPTKLPETQSLTSIPVTVPTPLLPQNATPAAIAATTITTSTTSSSPVKSVTSPTPVLSASLSAQPLCVHLKLADIDTITIPGLLSPFFEVKKSTQEDDQPFGVFALTNISNNTYLGDYPGKMITIQEAQFKRTNFTLSQHFILELPSRNHAIDPTDGEGDILSNRVQQGPQGRFRAYCSEPFAFMKEVPVGKSQNIILRLDRPNHRYCLITCRDIFKGDELFVYKGVKAKCNYPRGSHYTGRIHQIPSMMTYLPPDTVVPKDYNRKRKSETNQNKAPKMLKPSPQLSSANTRDSDDSNDEEDLYVSPCSSSVKSEFNVSLV